MKRNPTTARLVKQISGWKGRKLRNLVAEVMNINRMRPRKIKKAARSFYEKLATRKGPTAK